MATSKGKAKKVIHIEHRDELKDLLTGFKHKLVLVQFFATWCGPCLIVGPYLEKVANDYEDNLVVLKIDVDEIPELADKYNISALPAFMMIKNMSTLIKFEGNDAEKMRSSLQKFCGKAEKSKFKS